MKTTKAILLDNGKIMPAGTDLEFNDGKADFEGYEVQLQNIPYDACEYEMQSELSPIAWTDDKMKPEVRERLLAIANDFYANSGFKAPVIDIILSGSMCNFNYHERSDFDVHIVIDYAAENKDVEFVKLAANAIKWKWNEQHNITIEGHDVELYIQDVNEDHVASGIYSIKDDKWLVHPTIHTINTSESDVNAKAESIREQANALQEQIDNAKTDEELQACLTSIDELRYQALRLRKDAFEEGGDEFSVGNLAFKQLRNDGTIGRLLELENQIYDQLHSIK